MTQAAENAAGLVIGGRVEGRLHRMPVRVYYEDTDAAGIVYHASYLRYAERGRTEMLRAVGVELSALRERAGVQFVLHSADVKFHRPAHLDDLLTVETAITALGGVSLAVRQRVLDAAGKCEFVRCDGKLACVGNDGRPARLPADVKNKIQALVGEV